MPDIYSSAQRSMLMARIRSVGNKQTELRLIELLRKYRIRGWRRHQPLPGRPDFTFRAAKVAVFVDGCFWHGCPRHGQSPASNQDYWLPKLARTKQRDRRNTRHLRALGWRVIRLWEHDLKNEAEVGRKLFRAVAVGVRVTEVLPGKPPVRKRVRRPRSHFAP
jgi:DNA mismatch endonuclease, patch repair protein